MNILVPLCGKTKVLLRVADRGHSVVGIEWCNGAVISFFQENNLSYDVFTSKINGKEVTVYKGKVKNISMYCGDIFDFDGYEGIGQFDRVVDHSSIGAFHPDHVPQYASIICSMTKNIAFYL